MLGLRLALGAIALMAVLTASIGGLAVVDLAGIEEAPTLVLTLGGDGNYWDAVASGARAAAARRGVKLTVSARAEADGCATLAIVGGEESASCCGKENNSLHLFHVGIADYSAGRLCAHYAAKHVAAGGKIVALIDGSDDSASQPRLQGFRDTLRYYGREGESQEKWRIEVFTVVNSMSNAIAQHADAALVIDFTDGSAAALQKCFPEASADQRPRLVSFDSSEASWAAIETGELAAVVTHDPYHCGYQAVDRLAMYHRSDLIARPARGKGSILLPAQVVERGTLAEYRSRLKIAGAGSL